MFNKYGKAFAQVVMAVLVVAVTVTSDNRTTGEEWFQVVLAFGSAVSVYLVPAVPEWPWMKTAIAAVLAGVQTAGSVALDGVSTNDVLVIAVAAFGVALTALAPANTEQRHRSTQHPTLALLLVMGLTAGVALAPAEPAHADDQSELPGCQYWDAVVGGPGRENYFPTTDTYAHTDIVYVPGSWSACEDINVGNNGDAWNWRIRFFPSSGGNYANSWKSGCHLCSVTVATNVANGTRFRLEGRSGSGSTFQIYQRIGHVHM